MEAVVTPPVPPTRNWVSRHPVLFGAIVAAFTIASVGSFIFMVSRFMKSNGAYTGALSRAKSAPAVIESLGQPIMEGIWVMGSIRISGTSGSAQLAIPISGPKGKATIYVAASKALGEWNFAGLIVQVESSGKRIDLSERQTSPSPTPPTVNRRL